MIRSALLRGASACALLIAVSPQVFAQQSLPSIDIGAGAGAAPTPAPASDTPVTDGGGHSASGGKDAWGAHGAMDPTSYVAPDASSGTRTNTPVMETPLNVQVITPQVLRDRQIYTIEEAIKNVSGVTFASNSAHDPNPGGHITIRGFETGSYFRNGFRDDFGGSAAGGEQFANVDRVEVLKGSSAILYGLVDPGGIVNIVTKQPQEKAAYSVDQQIGSFATYRTTVGATGPVTADKSLLYRFDMSYENAHTFRDLEHGDTLFLAPVLKWNYDARTQATVEFEYQKSTQSDPYFFLPTYNGAPLNVPRNLNYGEYSPNTQERFHFGLNWSHQFNDDWTIRHRIQYVRTSYYALDFFPIWVADTGSSVQVFRQNILNDGKTDTFSTNADLIGHFNTGWAQHTLLAGGEFYRRNQSGNQNNTAADSPIDLFNPVHPGLAPPSGASTYASSSKTATYELGAYIQDQVKLPFGFHVMAGARYQDVTQVVENSDYRIPDWTTQQGYPNESQRVTPRFGVLWQGAPWFSVYGNYAEGFGPNGGSIFPGTPVPPSDSRQFEFGAKMELFDSRLRATAAYFDLTKTKIPTTDYAHPGYSVVVGEANAKGVEFDLQGEILPGWNVTLAYANTETRITKNNDTDSNGVSVVGSRFSNVPRNTASGFTSYEFKQGDLKGLKFGGGITYRDAQRILDYGDPRNQTDIAPYATVDMFGAYSFEFQGKKITAQLNVNNLLDHKYYSAGGNYYGLPVPNQGWLYVQRVIGEPRKFLGSLHMEF